MHKILFTSLVVFLIQSNVFGQGSWKLSEEKDGIKIYTSSVPDSKVKAIKVECEIKATQTQLVALLMDINSSADWVYHTKMAKVIKQVSPSELYYYSEVNLPWPAANRDFVAHLTVSQNPVTKVVVIDGPVVANMMPLKKGVVRINNSRGKWTIIPKGIDEVKIEYTLHTDPAGNLPAWMVNMFATEGPLKIFENLKQQIQKSDYKNASLPFIDNKQYALNTAY